MRPFITLLALALLPFSAHSQERGAPLPRKGFLGVASAPDPKGVKVVRVVAGSTFEKLGLKADDIIIELNSGRLTEPPQLIAAARTLTSGQKIEVKYLRDGKELSTSGSVVERPKQTEANLDVIYDQVVSKGKRIRIIITKPKGDGKFPSLFLIGGIGAYSIDGPFAASAYGNVLGPIANSGFATVRIDKPGQGDSEGPEYKKLSFAVEQDAYIQALRLVKTLPYIDANRIAIYGHSMGGCFGPLVASAEPVKAVIANGTLFKSFTEYMLENTRRQSELGSPGAESLDQELKQLSSLMYWVFAAGQEPAAIAKDHPELAGAVRQTFPDGETYSGVGIGFFRELSHINLPAAWKGTKANVLSLYGENDFLSGRDDHERIAAYVNSLRPGTAEFKLLTNTDHGFTKTTSLRDSMDKWGKGGEFNPLIIETLLAYLKKELR
jgi:uncharacterized protein